jgi:ubiquinone/menaquinone biosynthesis C-methylase UbiE
MFKLKPKLLKKNYYTFSYSDDITAEKVSDFYKIKPFPHYENAEELDSIVSKGDKNFFIKQLKDFIGDKRKTFLEVGAGTCQVSNYLAATTFCDIYACDLTKDSLDLGYKFAEKNKLENIKFIHSDIFDDVFQDNYFDMIYCSGVLHHTKSTEKSFKILCNNLKPGGYIVVGLYNKFGRLRTNFRQFVFKFISKKIAIFLDPYLRKLKVENYDKRESWIRDQYMHPVERSHSYDELLKMFEENKINFINSYPSKFINNESNIYKKSEKGNYFERLFEQLWMIFTSLGGEGGLFLFVGKKND